MFLFFFCSFYCGDMNKTKQQQKIQLRNKSYLLIMSLNNDGHSALLDASQQVKT